MDQQNRLGQGAKLGPAAQFHLQQVGVQVPGLGFAVNEDGASAEEGDGAGGGDEGEGGADHLVTGLKADQAQG